MKTNSDSTSSLASQAPFPFSVGFPLSIRPQTDSIAICGAKRGEGWPILCEVPKDTHHEKDADSIAKACTAYLDLPALKASNELLRGAIDQCSMMAEKFDHEADVSFELRDLTKADSPHNEKSRARHEGAGERFLHNDQAQHAHQMTPSPNSPRRITEQPPKFPCWIWSTNCDGFWWRAFSEGAFLDARGDDDIYWAPYAESEPPRPDWSPSGPKPEQVMGGEPQFHTVAEGGVAPEKSGDAGSTPAGVSDLPAAPQSVRSSLDRIKRLAGEILIPVSSSTSPMGRASHIVEEADRALTFLAAPVAQQDWAKSLAYKILSRSGGPRYAEELGEVAAIVLDHFRHAPAASGGEQVATTYTKSYSGKSYFEDNPLAYITIKVGHQDIVRVPASLLKELLNDLLEIEEWPAPHLKETGGDWQEIARRLWTLLDDIDTQDDASKNDDAHFRKCAYRIQQKRHGIIPGDAFKQK